MPIQGLLSSNHLVIAGIVSAECSVEGMLISDLLDQSKDGTLDKACLELARLCGLAVDYPKR
jgi:hypothetical protein